jgi:hypothetical protein
MEPKPTDDPTAANDDAENRAVSADPAPVPDPNSEELVALLMGIMETRAQKSDALAAKQARLLRILAGQQTKEEPQ